MAFIITLGAAVFCIAAVLAKNSRDITELKHRMESPMYGEMVHDTDDLS